MKKLGRLRMRRFFGMVKNFEDSFGVLNTSGLDMSGFWVRVFWSLGGLEQPIF